MRRKQRYPPKTALRLQPHPSLTDPPRRSLAPPGAVKEQAAGMGAEQPLAHGMAHR